MVGDKAVKVQTGRAVNPEGVEFLWREWPAATDSKAAMLFIHGAAEHSGRYEDFGRFFASRGIPVLAYDQRGLGRSGGVRGHLDDFGDYIRDAMFFREKLVERYPEVKPLLVGHSMGGLVALATAETHGSEFAAVVVSGPLLGMAVKVPGWKAALGRFMATVAPKFSMVNEIDPSVLARNPEVGRKYAADPDVYAKVSAGWFVEVTRGMEETNAGAGRISIPTFILQGTEDKLADPQASKRFFDRLGDVPKGFKFLEGFYHELFQENEKGQVFSFIKDWLEKAVF